ncbi:MAG TPA: GEVED domain-containing protein, partial [Chitinophagales bacterium]|nr:GEVED domain-containing protein [Chitinophagales bacterium]
YYATVSSSQSCTDYQYGETEDYTITLTPSTPMVFVSSTCTQNNTTSVLTGTNDVEIIGIQVVTQGAVSPFDLTSLDINSNGSDNFPNDVSNVKIYYTGTSSVFATTTLFGSSTTLPATITGSVTLTAGTNYFWVAYDVTTTATIGDLLDAECTSVTMTGNGGVQVPSITAPAGSRIIDYCVPTSTYGCYYGYIDAVVLNSLSNLFTGCNGNAGSYIQYAPAGNLTTSVEAGGTYSISLTGGPAPYEYVGFGVWIDFNNDGDFDDTGEFAWSSPFTAQGTQIGSISVPLNATLGDHRMRIRSNDYNVLYSNQSCGSVYYGESEDYTITITPQTNMSYVSSTVTQDNVSSVTSGQTDAEIIGIQILTSGSLSPFNATSFTILDNGTTDPADVTNVKIYYTGTNPNFSTGTLFGSSPILPSMVISGNQALAAGQNYFWVAYDVSGNATLGNFLDAECTQIVMDGAGGTQTPLVTAPAGNREINFCIGVNTYGCYYSYINGVTLNTLANTNTFCNGNVDGYIQYPQSGNTTTQLELGQTYSLQLDGPAYNYVGFGVWIDFNGNGSFSDPGDFVFSSPYLSAGSQFGNISLPCDANFVGDRRMRVRANYYTLISDTQSCTTFYNGETEDYTITLSPPSTNQTYTSSTCAQNNLSTVSAGTADAEIISIQVSADGCLNPLTVASFTLNAASTTDFFGDVTNVKIYYTGTDPNFSPTNLFGSVTDLSFPITGSQDLNSGTNYFWVAYDISANATLLDYVDAACTAIDITGQGVVTPSNSDPFGNRQINSCVPVIPNPCYYGDYINSVTLYTLSNLYSYCNGNPDNYISYAPNGNYTTTVQGGFTYSLTLASGYTALGFGVWIDFNNNNDFGDPGEFVYASPTYGYYYADSITIPIDPSFYGLRKMRVRGVDYSLIGAQDYCSNAYYGGETEDYMITIDPPPACSGTPVAGTISPSPAILCGGGNVDLTLVGFTAASGLTFQWQNSADGINWNNISGATSTSWSETLSTSTYYEVIVTCTNSGLSSTSPSVYVQVGGNEAITSTTGATVCGEGIADITAEGNATYIMWYDSPNSTSPLYYSSSPSTYSPYVNATTTYYATAADGMINSGHVGPVDYSIGYQVTYYTYVGEFFNVMKPCTIQGVYVYPSSAGDVILQLVDQNYNQLALDTLVVTAADINQKTWVPLDWGVGIGNNYLLRQYGGVNCYSNDYMYPGYPYPYTIPDVISITGSSYGTYYYFNVYDWVITYSTLCESAPTPITVTVTASPEITVTPTPANATICAGSGQSVALDVTGGNYTTFTWSPPDGLSATTGSSITASPLQSTQYIVQATDGNCTNYDTILVFVSDPPSVTVSASPDVVCAGGASQLYAATPALGYEVYQIPFAPDLTNGGTTVTLGDDQVSSAADLGFTFNFYGNDYTQFYISSNGFLSFDPNAANGCCQGQLLPDPFTPNNLIAFSWEDLYPPAAGGVIRYYTVGTAPYRKCVLEFKDVMHYPYPGADPVTIQTILYETTNWIEIHTTSMPGNPNGFWSGHTEGIENSDGTLALTVPGRNSDNTWTASDDAWRFAPLQYTYSWEPSATLDDATIANPIATPVATTTYTVTVTNASSSCSTTATVTVSLTTTPVAGTVTPDLTDFCGSGTAELDVTGYTPGSTLQWGESLTSGGPYNDIPAATSDNYTTPLLNTTTYYVVTATCTDSSTSAEATVQVDVAPNPPIAIDGFNCGPGHVVIGATASGNGELNWYYSQNGNNYLGSGSPFTTPYINQTTTFYVEEGGPPAQPLSTAYNGYYTSNGNMFDITALSDVFITGFDVNMQTFYTSDFEIYYKTGTYVGSEYLPQNWTLLGVAQGVQGLGSGVHTPIPLPLYLSVPAGQTVGIYITAASYYSYVNTSYGTAVGNVAAADNNIQIKEGNQMYYPFSYGYGPYVWNGTVHYVEPGCASARTPVVASITPPQVAATISDSLICEGDPITLVINNYGPQNFTYEWSPQLPGMIPQNGMNDTVTVNPPVTMTFTVSVTDPNAPLCDTLIAVPVTVNPTPVVFISNLATSYYLTDPPVTLIGVPPGGTFSGPGVTGSVFTPGSLAPGVYIITYTYTDANGCTGTYQEEVKILVVGIGSVEIDRDINFFPNPSEGLFNMTMKLPSAVQSVIVTIYDQIGQQVFVNDYGAVQQQLTSTFDFTLSPKGSYYVTINVDGQIFYRKITIQ